MKKLILIFIVITSVTNIAIAQNYETDLLRKSEIKKLDFLVGEWKGSGWIMGQDQIKKTFDQTETVYYKLDSTAILVEGLGSTEGNIIHNALAILTYSPEKNHYDFQSFLPSGQHGIFKSELIDEKFYWYPTNFIRYIVCLNAQEQYYEIGEINKGGNWYQFFEVTLDKLD